MNSSFFSPLYLTISDRDDLDHLLGGSGQGARNARQHVFTLVIKRVDHIGRGEWPGLPRLQHLTIWVDERSIRDIPRVLRASALPALRSLKLEREKTCQNGGWWCPVLEGRFEQLNYIKIYGFRMESKALDAVLRQLPNLTPPRPWMEQGWQCGVSSADQGAEEAGLPQPHPPQP